jgi:hypothetical protein
LEAKKEVRSETKLISLKGGGGKRKGEEKEGGEVKRRQRKGRGKLERK